MYNHHELKVILKLFIKSYLYIFYFTIALIFVSKLNFPVNNDKYYSYILSDILLCINDVNILTSRILDELLLFRETMKIFFK